MKYDINQDYQRLLSEQRYAYERIINNLESHIDWFEVKLMKYKKDPLETEIARPVSSRKLFSTIALDAMLASKN